MERLLLCLVVCLAGSMVTAAASPDGRATGGGLSAWRDPVSRYFHVTYDVPDGAPDSVTVACTFSHAGKNEWTSAKVTPLVSETAMRLVSDSDWQQWSKGLVTERRAAGLRRTVVFNPYPQAQRDGRVDVNFRVQVLDDDRVLADKTVRLTADNSDVICISDWSGVIQKDAVGDGSKTDKRTWAQAKGGGLYGPAGAASLPQLTYPLDLHGQYAIYVCTGSRSIGIRLTGDERTDRPRSRHQIDETLWRWTKMDSQHLVLKQLHTYKGYSESGIEYVRLVPLTDSMVKSLESPYSGKHDKTVIAYFEPYSWAFNENVLETLQHRQPLTAYAEAGVDVVDTQMGRFGMKVVYESRKTDQLLYSTIGDPIDGVVPETANVGQMQQYTNTLQAELKYARELGLKAFANFGASACYVGSPLQGDITKTHPDWLRGDALKFELKPARDYVLGLVRESLQEGAPGVSIDFCRYPECIDSASTCTTFLRELRTLTNEFAMRGKRPTILVRFPATGVRLCDYFDYATWAREGLVDYICPSNIQGRHMSFDIKPYVKAVRGTASKLTPVVDGISWGPTMPGPYLQRVKQLYDAGADGVYMYQADDRVLGSPYDRRTMRIIGSTTAVDRFWNFDKQQRPAMSKGIYLSRAEAGGDWGSYERLRVWLEGIEMGPVELYLDGKLVNKYEYPPYTLGTEGYESDSLLSSGDHTLRVRARDGNGWLEQTFKVRGQ